MTKEEFLSLVNDEVTSDCAVPFNVPTKTVERIIGTTLKWFYREYEYALEDRYLVIDEGYENGELFIKERAIKLPECVYSVFSVRVNNSNYLFGEMNRDFTYEKFIVDQSSVDSLTLSPSNVTYSTFMLLYLDVVDQLTFQAVSYNFNHLTRKLVLSGEIRSKALICTVSKKVPPENLFDDELFLKYVVGKVKQSLGRALGTVKMQLIGNAEIDFDALKEEGKEEVQEVIDKIKDDDSPDYFFMSPQ